jgi:hypothetical protein
MSDAKEYGVDFSGVYLPDLIGEHDGREAQDNSDGKETGVKRDRITTGAYYYYVYFSSTSLANISN